MPLRARGILGICCARCVNKSTTCSVGGDRTRKRRERLAELRTKTLYGLVGEYRQFDFNKRQGRVRLADRSASLEVFYVEGEDWAPLDPGAAVDAPLPYEGAMAVRSGGPGPHHAVLQNVLPSGEVLDELRVEFSAFVVRLDVDADRDGEVGPDEPGKAGWVWGEGQPGAIVVVNNDRDLSDASPREGEHSELSELLVRPAYGDVSVVPAPAGTALNLYATPEDARRFSVYRLDGENRLERVLGRGPEGDETSPVTVSPPLSLNGERCLIEAHEYPGPFFEGLLTVELLLGVEGRLVARDRVVLRVSPWIMTPNTLPVERVYACDVTTDSAPNSEFLAGLEEACGALGVPLTVIPPNENRRPGERDGDRWIQDEIEFGYSQGATHTLPVVCDSPRDRGLDAYPEWKLLGPDFGHFQVGGSKPNSLDSFGNLEVSPPVTARGRRYPLGRIVFGGRAYGDYGAGTRQMMPELRRFLYAQKVQSPVEIFTDWLAVGHADEILSFVPARNPKGFKLLLASPRKAESILRGLSEDGNGSAVMFEGKKRRTEDGLVSAEVAVDELLARTRFWEANAYFQQCMDLNKEVLKEELGLEEADVFAIPVLFEGPSNERTGAFFPDMVNHLVIGLTSIVPRPYGPVVDGECAFEKAFRESLPDRDVRFIDDWYSYHQMLGEVHCGTNARRTPFSDVRWWEHRPEGAYDL